MRRFLFFLLLLLGTSTTAPALPGRSPTSLSSETNADGLPNSGLLPSFSAATSPSPGPREEDEAEQLDRLGREKEAEEDDSRFVASVPPPYARLSSGHASGKETNGTPREEKRDQKPEWYRKYSGVKYAPADLADYITRTGDEESVALAVEELLREGIFTRAQAISYLQEVKNVRDRLLADGKTEAAASRQAIGKESDAGPTRFPDGRRNSPRTSERSGTQNRVYPGREEERVSEKPRGAASAREEYALEEIVFRLSKDALARSLLRGDRTAEESLEKTLAFLESEASEGRVSRRTERRILDAVSAALADTLKEFSDLRTDTHPFPYLPAPSADDDDNNNNNNDDDNDGRRESVKGRDSSGKKPGTEEGSPASSSRE